MLDIFLYIKLYSESMPYSGIFSTVGIFRQFQAHDSGIIQEQFTHILKTLLRQIQAQKSGSFRQVSFHPYSGMFTKSHITRHICSHSGIFQALPAQIMLTNIYSSSQVLLITVQIYLKHFFIFVSKVFSSGQYFNDNNSHKNSMAPVQTHHPPHPRYTRQHATHVSTTPTQAHYSRHPHQHATQERVLPAPPTLYAQACHQRHPRQRKYHAISQTLFIQTSIQRILNSYQENCCGKSFQKICFQKSYRQLFMCTIIIFLKLLKLKPSLECHQENIP